MKKGIFVALLIIFIGAVAVLLMTLNNTGGDSVDTSEVAVERMNEESLLETEVDDGMETVLETEETETESESEGPMNGWYLIDGKWYFMVDGECTTGKALIATTWYMFNSDGVMLTGWIPEGEEWYFGDERGHLLMNTFATLGTCKYYFFEDGIMARDETIEVDGVSYTFDERGHCISE